MLVGSKQAEQRANEHPDEYGKKQGDSQTEIYRKDAHAPSLVIPALPEQTGYERAAAHAGQAGKAKADVEHGQNKRGGRDHVRIVGLSDIEGVGHVVYKHDELAYHRRQNHDSQRRRHRHTAEHVLTGRPFPVTTQFLHWLSVSKNQPHNYCTFQLQIQAGSFDRLYAITQAMALTLPMYT